ncbi:hypothetical protein GCM10007855_36480 [Aliivibrio sifiae]|uniref:HTH-like domain-containing protein n=1 Tax=Aliivibrio sifiae TaxID=566293 RepID=A0ABQ6ARJ3_9GAMM|nr:hypothetical protein GCM10007855_36480 [Aliivibrio sifiae]
MGNRHIRNKLIKEGHYVNRKRTVRIMRDMGIGAIYPKLRTIIANKINKVHPCLSYRSHIPEPSLGY